MLTDQPEPFGPAYLKADDPPSKRKILQTALRLFAEHGVDAISVRRIAEEAGYTNPALFKFFDTKDSLALYLFESCYLQLFDHLNAAIGNVGTLEEQLDALLDVFLAQLEQDLDAFLYVQDNLRQFWPRVSAKARRKSILGLIRALLRRGIEEGSIRRTDVNLLVAALTGTLQQFARMLHFREFAGGPNNWRAPLKTLIRHIVTP